MATQTQAPRPLTDAEYANLSDDQLEKLGLKDSLHGAPAGFGGAVYPNPDNIKPMLDTDRGTPTRMPDGVTLSSPTYKGKAKMDTSNPPKAQLIPQGGQEIQSKTTGTPIPAGPSLLEQLADPDTHGQPPAPTPAGATSLLEQLAAGNPPSQGQAMPSGLPAGSSAAEATTHVTDQVLQGVSEGAHGLLDLSNDLNPGVQAYKMATQGLPSYIKEKIDKAVGALTPLKGATQLPSAVHDINQSPDAAQLYSDVAARTGGNLLVQGTAAGAGELGAGAAEGIDAEALQKASKKTGLDMASDATPKFAKRALEFAKNYRDALAAKGQGYLDFSKPATTAEAAPNKFNPDGSLKPEFNVIGKPDTGAYKPSPSPTKPTPRVKTPVTGAPPAGAPDVAAANGYTRPAVITNPQDIQSAVNDIVNGKTGRAAPLNSVELEKAMKSGQPVQTPVDVTEGARDLINKDVAKNVASPKVKSPETVSKISGETEALRNRPTTVAGKEVSGDADLTDALQKSIDAVKNNKPHWAYRTRDVGEVGVPDTDSHAHATSTLEDAKRLAPGKESVNGKPQEIVKFDLNKLKSHQYSTFSGPRGTPWIKVHGGLPEEAVEKVE